MLMDSLTQSRLFGLIEVCSYSILAHNVDHCSPTRKHVSVACCCYYLVQALLELLFLHAFSVVSFANGHQLFTSRSSALESFDHALGANGIIACKDWLPIIKACDDWLDNPASKSE
jgi:single-stranded DNA-specific DHH superfamily exonuclease